MVRGVGDGNIILDELGNKMNADGQDSAVYKLYRGYCREYKMNNALVKPKILGR
jgi:hypothetical protein